ncbi:MAG TPA: ABC transporter ATP-binding protein [Candidatus Thermoplasmatota archaeon]|nr:ABC transporter ATP-binding protein [Candidatus Thermoplasmatota archaeon]
MEANGVVVAAKGVTRVYGAGETAQAALKGVDVEVRQGEMVAIMGPSGCGKTTLLNCLSWLDKPTQGDVVLAGASLAAAKEPGLTRHRARACGFVFQAYNLIPVLTAEENVTLPLLTRGDSEKEARATAREMLASLGLAGKERRLPQDLSGGEQQRVAIARALAPRPAIVFADEPTGNLDQEKARDVLGILSRANREQGQTFVIVTHDTTVASACQRVIRMSNGLVVDGPARGG